MHAQLQRTPQRRQTPLLPPPTTEFEAEKRLVKRERAPATPQPRKHKAPGIYLNHKRGTIICSSALRGSTTCNRRVKRGIKRRRCAAHQPAVVLQRTGVKR